MSVVRGLKTVPVANNNNNNHDDIYSAVIVAEPLREFTRWIQHDARWPPTFGPSQSAGAAGPPI